MDKLKAGQGNCWPFDAPGRLVSFFFPSLFSFVFALWAHGTFFWGPRAPWLTQGRHSLSAPLVHIQIWLTMYPYMTQYQRANVLRGRFLIKVLFLSAQSLLLTNQYHQLSLNPYNFYPQLLSVPWLYINVLRLLLLFLVFMEFLDGSTHLYMRECPSDGRSVRRMDGWMVTCYFRMLEMAKSLNENHWADQL